MEIAGLFSIKVVVGIGFMLFYQFYYGDRTTTDAFRFYDDAGILFELFQTDSTTFFKIIFGLDMQSEEVVTAVGTLDNWYKEHLYGVFNDNMTIIRFNALVRLISFDVYHFHTLIINALSFLGLAALIKAANSWVSNRKLTFLCLLLFPGILFWSSGVLKESLLLFTMGFLVLFTVKSINEFNSTNLIGLVVFTLLSLMIKNYVALTLFVGFGYLIFSKYIKMKLRYSVPTYVLIICSVVLIFDQIFGLKIPQSVYQKQHDFLNEVAIRQPGSAFETFVIDPNWLSLFSNAPQAFINSLFRPFFWEAHSIVSLIASFEVLLLITIGIVAVNLRRRISKQMSRFIASLLLSALFILILIGWVTPVFGALVRYKVPALILLLLALNVLVDSTRIPIINKWI